jgi:hypothetical protein
MIHCATERRAGLVIVTRDLDYGAIVGKESFINDALRHEFSDRVSRKRPLLLYSRLSDALRFFEVRVTEQEEASEAELVSRHPFLTSELFQPFESSPQTRNAYEALFPIQAALEARRLYDALGNVASHKPLISLLDLAGDVVPDRKTEPPKEEK